MRFNCGGLLLEEFVSAAAFKFGSNRLEPAANRSFCYITIWSFTRYSGNYERILCQLFNCSYMETKALCNICDHSRINIPRQSVSGFEFLEYGRGDI